MTPLVLQLGLPNRDPASNLSGGGWFQLVKPIVLGKKSAKLKRPEFSKEGTPSEIQATPSEIQVWYEPIDE